MYVYIIFRERRGGFRVHAVLIAATSLFLPPSPPLTSGIRGWASINPPKVGICDDGGRRPCETRPSLSGPTYETMLAPR